MLAEDLSIRRLMKPQPSPVDCQMLLMHRFTHTGQRLACRRQATHVVVVQAGCWRAVCIDHANAEPNLGKEGRSFEITYDAEACPHLRMQLVDLDDPNSEWDQAWFCIDCEVTF